MISAKFMIVDITKMSQKSTLKCNNRSRTNLLVNSEIIVTDRKKKIALAESTSKFLFTDWVVLSIEVNLIANILKKIFVFL